MRDERNGLPLTGELVVEVNNESMFLLPLVLLAVRAAMQEKSLSTPFHEYTGCSLTVADMGSRLTLHRALSIKTKGPIRQGPSFPVSLSFSYNLIRIAVIDRNTAPTGHPGPL